MSDALRRMGISAKELQEMISRDANVDAELTEFMAKEVVPYWKSIAPKGYSKKYAASVKVTKKARRGKGAVGATDFKAHWIEFGTGEPGPTQAFAPGEQTARHFGGSLDGSGIDFGGGDE